MDEPVFTGIEAHMGQGPGGVKKDQIPGYKA
jgi:hypothetical protein